LKRILLWLALLVAFAGALWGGWAFRAGNSATIDLDLIWIRVPGLELWWVLMTAIGTGLLFGALLVGFAWLRLRLLVRRYRSAIRRLEKEVHELRSLPLQADETENAAFPESTAQSAVVGRG